MSRINGVIRGFAGSPLNPNKGVGPLVDLNFLQSTYTVRASAFNSTAIPALTVTRASVGYAETAAGVLVPFASGEARITDKGCLVEEARTNVALWARDLTNAAWVKTNLTAALSQTGADGGANSASLITATAANATALQSITLGSSARFQTAYVKRITGSGAVEMTMDNGATWTAITVTSAFTRASIPTQTLANPVMGFRVVTSGDAIAVDFVQNETGTFSTSPIITTTAPATRAADQITVSSVAVPLTNFTLYAEVALDSLAGGGYQGVAALDDGTSANQVYLFKTTGTNRARGGVDIASAGVFDTASLPSTLPVLAAGVSKLAFIRAGGIVRVEANGILYPDTTQAALPVLSRLIVGSFNGNSFPTNGYVRRITLMDRAVGGLTA